VVVDDQDARPAVHIRPDPSRAALGIMGYGGAPVYRL